MRFLSLICASFCFLTQSSISQIYEVPCSVQQSDAYKWGTSSAFMLSSIALGAVPPLTVLTPPGAGNAIGAATTAIWRFLWPMIIGQNDRCVAIAIREMMARFEQLTNQKVNNVTVEEIRRWFDGHADTAKKVYEWIPIIKNAKDETSRRDASIEFLKGLKYLYYSANEARDSFVEGTVAQSASFFALRELAFLQFGVSAEIVANKYTPDVVKKKFLEDYKEDVEFYWRSSHVAVEKLVRCLPNDDIAKARLGLSNYLRPLYDFAYKFIEKNGSAQYSRHAVYKPITSGDFVALRLNDGKLAVFESIFRIPPHKEGAATKESSTNSTCPICGWDLFDDRFSPNSHYLEKSFPCRDSVFDITNGQQFGAPIRTCEIVALSYRPQFIRQQIQLRRAKIKAEIEGAQDEKEASGIIQNAEAAISVMVDAQTQPPMFVVSGYNESTNELVTCGRVVLNRDRIQLTPVSAWLNKVNTLDVVILKAE